MPESGIKIDRLSLMQILNGIPQEQLLQIIFTLNPPRGIIPPNSASQGQQVFALLEWADGPSGCGLEEVQAVLDEIIKPRNHSKSSQKKVPSLESDSIPPEAEKFNSQPLDWNDRQSVRLRDYHGVWCPVCLKYFQEDKDELTKRIPIYPNLSFKILKNSRFENLTLHGKKRPFTVTVHEECYEEIEIVESKISIDTFNDKELDQFASKLEERGFFHPATNIRIGMSQEQRIMKEKDTLKKFLFTSGGSQDTDYEILLGCWEQIMQDCNEKPDLKEISLLMILAGPMINHKNITPDQVKKILRIAKERPKNDKSIDGCIEAEMLRRIAMQKGQHKQAKKAHDATIKYKRSEWSTQTSGILLPISAANSKEFSTSLDYFRAINLSIYDYKSRLTFEAFNSEKNSIFHTASGLLAKGISEIFNRSQPEVILSNLYRSQLFEIFTRTSYLPVFNPYSQQEQKDNIYPSDILKNYTKDIHRKNVESIRMNVLHHNIASYIIKFTSDILWHSYMQVKTDG